VGHFTPERTYAMAIQAFDESIAKYIALRLAILFENYAIAFTDKFCDHQLANTSDQHAGEYIKKIPIDGDEESTLIALEKNTINMAYRALELGKRLRCE
jgi:hypothetical protein